MAVQNKPPVRLAFKIYWPTLFHYYLFKIAAGWIKAGSVATNFYVPGIIFLSNEPGGNR